MIACCAVVSPLSPDSSSGTAGISLGNASINKCKRFRISGRVHGVKFAPISVRGDGLAVVSTSSLLDMVGAEPNIAASLALVSALKDFLFSSIDEGAAFNLSVLITVAAVEDGASSVDGPPAVKMRDDETNIPC